jgi:hypothetical protein
MLDITISGKLYPSESKPKLAGLSIAIDQPDTYFQSYAACFLNLHFEVSPPSTKNIANISK